MKIKTLPLLLTSLLSASALVSCGGNAGGDVPYDLSGITVTHSFVTESNLIHARFPGNDGGVMGNEENGFGVNWGEYTEAEKASFTIDNPNSTYARMVIDAPFTGDYPVQLNAKHFNLSYPMRVYVNSKNMANKQDVTVTDTAAWGDQERTSNTFNIHLKKGKNVVLVQVYDWGFATGFTLPEELDVIKAKGNKTNEYTQDDFIFQAAYLESSVNILDPDAKVVYKGLESNGDPNFEGAVILNFTPANTTKSLDITYKIEEKTANTAGITLRLGTNALNCYTADVSEEAVNQTKTLHIPSYELADLGFNTSAKQTIHVTSASGKVQILGVKESTVQDTAPSYTVLNPAQIRERVLIRGRNIMNSNSIGLDWTSAGIEFEITGGGDVVANMEEVNDHFGNKGTAAGGTRFAVEIDGRFENYVIPSANAKLASNLSASKHKVAIYKTSEACGGLVNLMSLKVGENATITKPTKDYKFEILGDSITCGNQISSTEENGYLAYTTQLSNSWNANLNAISVSGRGLKLGYNAETGWNASWDNQINTLWNKTSYFRDGGTAQWNHADYQPDVVIANLGNNDLGEWIMSIAPMTIGQFTDEVVSFSQLLRSTYPNAKIVWCYGAFVNRRFENEYRTAVESLNDPNMDFVYFNQMGGGADNHPNAAEHQTIADILSAKIAEMLNVTDPRAK